MKKKNEELGEELKKIHSNAIKQQTERQQSIERLMSLPKRPLINYERKEKPAAENSKDEEQQKAPKKPPIPTRSGISARSPSAAASKKGPTNEKSGK